uniref:Uncharacterized protein n=1 Tax=Rhizophora mucronata TaxID=61149 RepID=A0A2P2NJB4_RHIMU
MIKHWIKILCPAEKIVL